MLAAASLSNGSSPAFAGGIRLLLVEDDADVAEVLRIQLGTDGFVIDVCTTVEQAIHKLQSSKYDLVIADMRLGHSHRGGLEILERMESSMTPILIVTAYSDEETVKLCLNHGADYFIEKPIRKDELLRVIHEKMKLKMKRLSVLVDDFLLRYPLTEREKEIARHVLRGLSSKEIAHATAIAERTVKCHLNSIFRKCSVKSRAEFFSAVFPI